MTAARSDAVEDRLRELSDVLGVPVLAVEDRLDPRTSRKRGHVRWVLDVRSPAGGTWRAPVVDSADFRSVAGLTAWTRHWGRDGTAEALTEEDGRRALRLMHEVVEGDRLAGRVRPLYPASELFVPKIDTRRGDRS